MGSSIRNSILSSSCFIRFLGYSSRPNCRISQGAKNSVNSERYLPRKRHFISKESTRSDFFLSVIQFVVMCFLWIAYFMACSIHFSLNSLFLSHNNENVRGCAIKAFLIVSYSVEWMRVWLTLFIVLKQWAGRQGSDFVMQCQQIWTELQEWGVTWQEWGGQRHLVM